MHHVLALPGYSSRIDMERSQSSTMNSSPVGQFGYLANSLAQLLETARRELERDREAAKVSLATASTILQAEIERCSGANGSTRGGLPGWLTFRLRGFLERH